MPKNIKDIRLWVENPQGYNGIPIVRIDFNFPCEYTVLDVDTLKQIIRLWIQGEETKYPLRDGFAGRWMLFKEIEKIFHEGI